MPDPVLVVDLGSVSTGAAVVVGDQATLLREPVTGAPRRATPLSVESGDLAALTAFLAALRAEALRVGPIERLTLTVPASYQVPDRRRDLLVSVGEAAGFAEVELLGAAAAVTLEAIGGAARNVGLEDGSLVLVCDLGQTWSTALLRITRGEAFQIMQETSTAGRDLDHRLFSDLRAQAGDWLESRLAAPGEAGRRYWHEAADFIRQVKHALSPLAEDGEVARRIGPDGPVYGLTREWLDRLAEPGLRWVGGSCRSLLARAAARWSGGGPGLAGYGPGAPAATVAQGSTMADVAAVILAGGHAHLAVAEQVLRQELLRPVIRLDDPELAAVRGGVRFAMASPARRLLADHPKWRVEPLSWDVPTGRARLERWLVAPGEAYQRQSVLARVRTADDRVYDLLVPEDGVLLGRRGRDGDVVGPTLIASAKRPASLLAGDPPDKRQELTGSGEWLLTPDRRLLVECADGGERVRMWTLPDGVMVREFHPDFDSPRPRQGRVFIPPSGRPALVAWDTSGAFSVWDVRSGRRTATFRDAHGPSGVLVNEHEWRLSVASDDAGTVGRYRRSVATVWDLTTGRKLEKLTDDWQRRLPGYRERSTADGFGEHAFSPDGRLRAVPVVGQTGPTGIALQEATSEHEVFRAEHGPSVRVRVAFSADGELLLANRESPQRSQVDVWEL
jgi:hypothetical protein